MTGGILCPQCGRGLRFDPGARPMLWCVGVLPCTWTSDDVELAREVETLTAEVDRLVAELKASKSALASTVREFCLASLEHMAGKRVREAFEEAETLGFDNPEQPS